MLLSLASVLVALQSAAGGAAAPPAFVFSHTLVLLASQDRGEPFEDQWVSAAENQLWVLDTANKSLRLFRGLAEQKVVPWPPQVAASQQLGVAATKQQGVYLVEKQAGRVWRFSGEKWEGPWRVPPPLGGVAALANGSLLVNLPADEKNTLLVLDPAGGVVRRFAPPLSPEHPSLREASNTWSVATVEGGRVVAAHRFLPLLRWYNEEGSLLQELPMSSPTAQKASQRRKELLGQMVQAGAGCCVNLELPVFAVGVVPGPQGGFYLQMGGARSLEFYTAEGQFVATVPVVSPPKAGPDLPRSRGLAVVAEGFAAAFPTGVAVFRPAGGSEPIHGLVLDPEGVGVFGARVQVLLEPSPQGSGTSLQPVFTDSSGAFVVRLPREAAAGEVRVRAQGFREVVRAGTLREILHEPITLPRADEYCVRVEVPAGARMPEKFRVTLLRRIESSTGAGGETGPSAEFPIEAQRPCLAAPWAAPVVVAVQAPGFARAERRTATPGWVTVPLELEARLELTVVLPNGEPGVGARVVLLAGQQDQLQKPVRAWASEEEAVVDQEGKAHLAGLLPGAYVLWVQHETALPLEKPVELAVGDNHLAVELSQGATVLVHLRDRQGSPISGAEVVLAGGRKPFGCTTDAEGACEMKPVPQGFYRLRASHGQHGVVTRQLALGEDRLYRIELRFAGGLRVAGVVEGVERYPDRVLVVRAEQLRQAHTAPVEPGGAFALEGLSPGEWVFWVEDTIEDVTLASKWVRIPEAGLGEPVRIQLPPPKVVQGRVTVKEGPRQLPCGRCELLFRLASPQAGAAAVTAATAWDGSYEARLPVSGTYLVLVEDKDSGTKAEFSLQVDRSLERDFVLAGLSLQGRVRWASGDPAPAVAVRLFLASASQPLLETLTDEEGRFRFRPGKPGLFLVQAVGSHGVVSEQVELRPGLEREVELRFEENEQRLRLRVRSAATGSPVGTVGLAVFAPGRPPVVWPSLVTGEQGTVSVAAPGPGPWQAVVESPGLGRVVVEGATPGAAPTEVLLPEASALALRSKQGPLCGVLLQDASGRPYPLALETAPGFVAVRGEEVVLTRVAAGGYLLTGELCSGGRQTVPVTVQPGTIAIVELGPR